MSRIGKLAIELPDNVGFKQNKSKVVINGPKGEIEKIISFNGEIIKEDGKIKVVSVGRSKGSKAIYGLVRSLINNMVIGVSKGYSKTLKIVGVGYKAQINGKSLVLNLGYSHPINYSIPEGVKIEVPDQNTIEVHGIDKELVGQTAADIRKYRKPESYKGKGIMYIDEKIRRKAGKAAVK